MSQKWQKLQNCLDIYNGSIQRATEYHSWIVLTKVNFLRIHSFVERIVIFAKSNFWKTRPGSYSIKLATIYVMLVSTIHFYGTTGSANIVFGTNMEFSDRIYTLVRIIHYVHGKLDQ